MSILVDENTKVVVHGITGGAGSLHTKGMLDYGTKIVAGVRPGAAGQEVHGVKVYDTAAEAEKATDANASILFVPAKAVKASAIESLNSGVKLVVIVSEHVPLHDTMEILEVARKKGAHVVGPNTAGLISPHYRCKIGFVPEKFFTPGNVMIASRSGTLVYEMAARLNKLGIGQSFCIGVGGDPVIGMRFAEMLKMAEKDENTKASILIGEIGGTQEEEASTLIETGVIKKPVFAYISGRFAPKGRTMGHAGAIASAGKGTIQSKLDAFEHAGVFVGKTPDELISAVRNVVKGELDDKSNKIDKRDKRG